MLKDDLLPASCLTIEVIGLLRFGSIIERPFQPTVFQTAITPFVTTTFIAVFIEKCYLSCRECFFVTLITSYLSHEIGVGIHIVSQKG